MDHDSRYQDGKDGPLTREIRDRIRFFQTLGSTLADIGDVLGFSGSFISQLLNDKRPGRIRTIHVSRIIGLLEEAERNEFVKSGKKLKPTAAEDSTSNLPGRTAPLGVADKPQMFVASSAENVQIAYDVQESLLDTVDATVWTQGVFRLSKTTMESLVDQLPKSDFGVFVLAPNDVTEIRGTQQHTVRDNVVFELGLFIGHLGRERCFLVAPIGVEDLHLPTDLLSVVAAKYDPNRQDNNLLASLGPATNRIRKEVTRLGKRKRG